MGQGRNAYRASVGQRQGNRPPVMDGRVLLKWGLNKRNGGGSMDLSGSEQRPVACSSPAKHSATIGCKDITT
jgi:hypothetical protein